MNIKFSIFDGHKNCSICKTNLPVKNFRDNLKIKSGLNSACKICTAKYHKSRHTPSERPVGRPRKMKSPKKIVVSLNPSILEGFKECSKCLIIKEKNNNLFCKGQNFSGLSSDCKECRSKYYKKYRNKNKEKVKEAAKISYEKYKHKRKENNKIWIKNNRERINHKIRQKRKENPTFRMSTNLRSAVKDCVQYNKFRKTSKLNKYLGCNSQEFKEHIKNHWHPNMTWENYGNGPNKWNLDHTIPLASAKSIEEIYSLSHYSNIKPMWSVYNVLKKNKMPNEWASYKIEKKIDEALYPLYTSLQVLS